MLFLVYRVYNNSERKPPGEKHEVERDLAWHPMHPEEVQGPARVPPASVQAGQPFATPSLTGMQAWETACVQPLT